MEKNNKTTEKVITPNMRRKFWDFNINSHTGMFKSNILKRSIIDKTVSKCVHLPNCYKNLQI